MKLSFALLCLASLIPASVASNRAGPYQTMLFWYAYRMEIETYGVGQTWTATWCPGTAQDGSCYFDEFIKHIQRKGNQIIPFTGKTSVGQKLNPSVSDTADELHRLQYQAVTDATKLLPGTFDRPDEGTFEKVMNQIITAIQSCRQTKGDAAFKSELDNVRRAMLSVHQARKADQAAGLIRGVEGQGFTVQSSRVTAPDGSSYMEIDMERTLLANPDADVELKNKVQDYITNYDETRDGSRHAKTVRLSQGYESILLGPPPAPGCKIEI